MIDALDIANLKARYCAAADTAPHDADAATRDLRACFAPNATADYGFSQFDDPEPLIAFLVSAVGGGSAWIMHMVGSPQIVVHGDAATGDWACAVQSRRRDGEMMAIHGRYSDRFRRTVHGWKIAHIGFTRFE